MPRVKRTPKLAPKPFPRIWFAKGFGFAALLGLVLSSAACDVQNMSAEWRISGPDAPMLAECASVSSVAFSHLPGEIIGTPTYTTAGDVCTSAQYVDWSLDGVACNSGQCWPTCDNGSCWRLKLAPSVQGGKVRACIDGGCWETEVSK
jgi:hypothetical protein